MYHFNYIYRCIKIIDLYFFYYYSIKTCFHNHKKVFAWKTLPCFFNEKHNQSCLAWPSRLTDGLSILKPFFQLMVIDKTVIQLTPSVSNAKGRQGKRKMELILRQSRHHQVSPKASTKLQIHVQSKIHNWSVNVL